ncbi:MAG: hypothetical protein ACRD3N_15730 [Terracidiphilus sp.]
MRFRRAGQPSFPDPPIKTAWLSILILWAVVGVLPAAGQDRPQTPAPVSTQTPAPAATQTPAPASTQTSTQTSTRTTVQAPQQAAHHVHFRIPYTRDAESFAPPGSTSSPAPAAAAPSAVAAAAHPDAPAGAAAPKTETPDPDPAPRVESAAIAGAGGKNSLAGECSSMLRLAANLKREVDKTTKDELSVAVVRDAGQIEQMARQMREDTVAKDR